MNIDKKTDLALDIISKKLFSEGVSAKNWRSIKALYIISHCVLGKKLANYLVDNEEEIKRRIEVLSQIKQINATENTESLPYIKQ